LVEQVASPPYDVLNSKEARKMAAENPHSFLHVVKAEIDLPEGASLYGEEVYEKSRENLLSMIENGVLARDERECFYVYELQMGGHRQRGLVAGASAEEYANGTIRKHEHTRREKEDDRARHMEVLEANAGPVLFTYRAQTGIRAIIDDICSAEPCFDFSADDGVGHRLWKVSDPGTILGIRAAFEQVPALYVADGHHRSASAHRVRDLFRDRNPEHTGEEAYNHFLAVIFPDDELQILGYHRVIRDLNGLSPDDLLGKIGEKFRLSPCEAGEPGSALCFRMFLDGQWYHLEALEGSFPAEDPVRSLDVAILQENLLAPILGIGDPRSDSRIDFVGGIRGIAELERRCSEDMKIAFVCHPVSVEQLMTIADSGEVMPPKSTWFEPKLRSGVVVRSLKD
jgi:uncharacterized protein (DUF1015 family)